MRARTFDFLWQFIAECTLKKRGGKIGEYVSFYSTENKAAYIYLIFGKLNSAPFYI